MPADVARVFREEYGRAVAVLVRMLGDIDAAEEAVQDAFAVAAERWPRDGVPAAPAGWIITTARRSAIDRHRSAVSRDANQIAAARRQPDPPPEAEPLHDDELRLIFTCCHPALAVPAQVALTLKLLGGLETSEIAGAFLVDEATMAQRLVRAKAKIRTAAIPYRVPDGAELPDRLPAILGVIYLIFSEGHRASAADTLTRDDLAREAVRLARRLADLMPDEPEVLGLLALLLLTHARRAARTDAAGGLVPLPEQPIDRWDAALIAEGHGLVRRCLARNQPGTYQLQAAIAAVHTDPPTEWRQVLALYDQLLAIQPSPVVALNRAVAVAEVQGPAAALAVVDALALEDHHGWHVVRAELLTRLGRAHEAGAAYDRAIAGTGNGTERAFLEDRRARRAG